MKRDADRIKQVIHESPEGQVITKANCKIQVPSRFLDRELAIVGEDIYVFGVYALILEDGTYSVCTICAMQKIAPYKVEQVSVGGVKYHEFSFSEGDVVIKDTTLVKNDLLMYNLIDEIYFKGKVPWYINYEDLGKLFNTSRIHANSGINDSLATIELLASIAARNPDNLMEHYCLAVEDREHLISNPPTFVPLSSVYYSRPGTLHKIAGPYFNDGIISALVSQSDTVDNVERLLRV